MWGLNTVPTVPPSYSEEALDMSRWPLSEAGHLMLSQYQANLKWLKLASLKAILPEWRSGQVVPLVYPETTRSRDGLIQRGREETDVYFRHGWILPLHIQGPGEIFPPEGDPDWKKIIRREFKVTVAAGELISGECLHSPKTLDWLKEREATPVDFVMSRIVDLDPERVNPALRPLYDSLSTNIPKGLLLRAA